MIEPRLTIILSQDIGIINLPISCKFQERLKTLTKMEFENFLSGVAQDMESYFYLFSLMLNENRIDIAKKLSSSIESFIHV